MMPFHILLRWSGCLLFLWMGSGVCAQQRSDSLRLSDVRAYSLLPVAGEKRVETTQDTPVHFLKRTHHKVRHFFTHNYPDPPKAALFSIVPGGGQLYNRRFWKAPIVWGLLAGFGVWQYQTTSVYKDLSTAYRERVNDRPVFNTRYANLSTPSLLRYRDQYRRYTENLWLGIGLTYLLGAAEAYVDAHLRNFDVDDNLTLRPVLTPAVGPAPAFGLGMRWFLSK